MVQRSQKINGQSILITGKSVDYNIGRSELVQPNGTTTGMLN
jgi:hypothetical protein